MSYLCLYNADHLGVARRTPPSGSGACVSTNGTLFDDTDPMP